LLPTQPRDSRFPCRKAGAIETSFSTVADFTTPLGNLPPPENPAAAEESSSKKEPPFFCLPALQFAKIAFICYSCFRGSLAANLVEDGVMSWRESRLGKVWASVSRYGLYQGLQDATARWLRTRSQIPQNVLGEYAWILTPDRPASARVPAPGRLRINWLIPSLGGKGSGGLLNIFRTIQYLEQSGHEHRVYVVGQTADSGESATELARTHYFPVRSKVEIFTGTVADSDALVATDWPSAYVARGLGNTARKFYFVQDLEHLFFPAGSASEFAKETYRWGFYGITAGQWIADVLQRDFGMACSSFGFSYDRSLYAPPPQKQLAPKQRVLFYARPRTERRGFELGILALSLVAKQRPDTEFVLPGFPPRSVQLPFPAVLPGVLPTSELGELYRSCTVALVLSHTNLSLLPLELMACGCALVSNSGPNVEWLLTDAAAQLAKATPAELAAAVLLLLENEQLRDRKAAAGLALAQGTDWTEEIKRIEAGLYRGLNMPLPVHPHG
jgi:glycosyltransferase involved in cell wall biosynthesis